MKKLFALMALAGLAAFQVGCGDSATPAKITPPSATSPMPGMPAASTDKKDGDAKPAEGEKKAGDEAAPAGDEKPAEEATPEKKDE